MARVSKTRRKGHIKTRLKRAFDWLRHPFRRSARTRNNSFTRLAHGDEVGRKYRLFQEAERPRTAQPNHYRETRPAHVELPYSQGWIPSNGHTVPVHCPRGPNTQQGRQPPKYDKPYPGTWPNRSKSQTANNKEMSSSLLQPPNRSYVQNMNTNQSRRSNDSNRSHSSQRVPTSMTQVVPRPSNQQFFAPSGVDHPYSARSRRGSDATQDVPRTWSMQSSRDRYVGSRRNSNELPPSTRSRQYSPPPPHAQFGSNSWRGQTPNRQAGLCHASSSWDEQPAFWKANFGAQDEPVPDRPLRHKQARTHMKGSRSSAVSMTGDGNMLVHNAVTFESLQEFSLQQAGMLQYRSHMESGAQRYQTGPPGFHY